MWQPLGAMRGERGWETRKERPIHRIFIVVKATLAYPGKRLETG
jgi:hypothetical protein